MAKIIIEVSDIDDAANYCREVAEKIEEGYSSGLVGWTDDAWSLEH